jgi:RNA binding exosome subunit
MSVSPTDDALIVALDFEGEFDTLLSKDARYHLRMDKQQAYTVSNDRLRRIPFSFSSILLFLTL